MNFTLPQKARAALWAKLLILPTLLTACGYVPVASGAGSKILIHVPPTVNDSQWRGLEIDFTRALRTDLRRTLLARLDSTAAQFTLRTEISQADRRLPIRNRDGGTLLGLSELGLRWHLEDAKGDSLASGELTRSLEFLPSIGEDPYRAFAEILDQMSETVVLQVSETLATAQHIP